jgi:hypothetical protein
MKHVHHQRLNHHLLQGLGLRTGRHFLAWMAFETPMRGTRKCCFRRSENIAWLPHRTIPAVGLNWEALWSGRDILHGRTRFLGNDLEERRDSQQCFSQRLEATYRR